MLTLTGRVTGLTGSVSDKFLILAPDEWWRWREFKAGGWKSLRGFKGCLMSSKQGSPLGRLSLELFRKKKGKKKTPLYAARLSIMPQAGDSSPGIRRADLDIFSMGVGGGSTSTTFEVSVTEFHHHQISVWTRTASLFVINQFEFSG